MARFFVIVCVSAFVAMCSSSAIIAGSSGRGLGGATTITDCEGSLITLNAADCVLAEDNQIVAGILGGAVLLTCNQQCTNNSTCYDFSLLSKSGNSPVVGSKGNQRPEDSYRCCTTDGTGNIVNCGGQKCTATSAAGSNSEAKCCTYCSDGRLISALPTH